MNRWIAICLLVSTLLLSVGSAFAEAAPLPGGAGSLSEAGSVLFWSSCCDGPARAALPQPWPDATPLLRKQGNRPTLTDGLPTADPVLRRRGNAPRLDAPNGQIEGERLMEVDQYAGTTILRRRPR